MSCHEPISSAESTDEFTAPEIPDTEPVLPLDIEPEDDSLVLPPEEHRFGEPVRLLSRTTRPEVCFDDDEPGMPARLDALHRWEDEGGAAV